MNLATAYGRVYHLYTGVRWHDHNEPIFRARVVTIKPFDCLSQYSCLDHDIYHDRDFYYGLHELINDFDLL